MTISPETKNRQVAGGFGEALHRTRTDDPFLTMEVVGRPARRPRAALNRHLPRSTRGNGSTTRPIPANVAGACTPGARVRFVPTPPLNPFHRKEGVRSDRSWKCRDCGCMNRPWERCCYVCGAGHPDDARAACDLSRVTGRGGVTDPTPTRAHAASTNEPLATPVGPFALRICTGCGQQINDGHHAHDGGKLSPVYDLPAVPLVIVDAALADLQAAFDAQWPTGLKPRVRDEGWTLFATALDHLRDAHRPGVASAVLAAFGRTRA
jgi:hypothetical protein